MPKSFDTNESDFSSRLYTVTLSHKQIQSLLEWMPKNYDSDDEIRLGIEQALNNAKEIEKK